MSSTRSCTAPLTVKILYSSGVVSTCFPHGLKYSTNTYILRFFLPTPVSEVWSTFLNCYRSSSILGKQNFDIDFGFSTKCKWAERVKSVKRCMFYEHCIGSGSSDQELCWTSLQMAHRSLIWAMGSKDRFKLHCGLHPDHLNPRSTNLIHVFWRIFANKFIFKQYLPQIYSYHA